MSSEIGRKVKTSSDPPGHPSSQSRRRVSAAVDPGDQRAAVDVAMRIVGGASQSAAALQRKLERRGFDGDTASAAVARMGEYGYVDDTALADSIIGRRQRQGYGSQRIAGDLRARGIDASVISDAVAGVDQAAELTRAADMAQRWRRSHPGTLDRAALSRAGAALQRRGFRTTVIRAVLDDLRSADIADSQG